MINAKIADNMVQRVRVLITSSPISPIAVPIEELVEILECLERLAILERHLTNLVSTAYDKEENAK